MLTMAIPNNDL